MNGFHSQLSIIDYKTLVLKSDLREWTGFYDNVLINGWYLIDLQILENSLQTKNKIIYKKSISSTIL